MQGLDPTTKDGWVVCHRFNRNALQSQLFDILLGSTSGINGDAVFAQQPYQWF